MRDLRPAGRLPAPPRRRAWPQPRSTSTAMEPRKTDAPSGQVANRERRIQAQDERGSGGSLWTGPGRGGRGHTRPASSPSRDEQAHYAEYTGKQPASHAVKTSRCGYETRPGKAKTGACHRPARGNWGHQPLAFRPANQKGISGQGMLPRCG